MAFSDLRQRTKAYALEIIKIYSLLPKETVAQTIGRQVLRSGTPIGAHYREANRARSNKEFISKIEIGLQELDETAYWLELLADSKRLSPDKLAKAIQETDELTAIFVTIVKKSKQK